MVTKYIANREGLLRALAKAKVARVVDDVDRKDLECLECGECEAECKCDEIEKKDAPKIVSSEREAVSSLTLRDGLFFSAAMAS